MFSLAVRWGWRSDNPAKGLERNPEVKRQRFLRPDEIGRLTAALAAFPDRQAADIVRLLTLTGARRNEVLAMRWDQIDLAAGVWTKPGATTKQKTEHRVPLSAAARQLLAGIPQDSEWVFPGTGASGHREGIKSAWPAHLPRRRAGGAGRQAGRADPRSCGTPTPRVLASRRPVAADHRGAARPHPAPDDRAIRAPARRPAAGRDGAGGGDREPAPGRRRSYDLGGGR